MIEHSDDRNELYSALAKAQGQIKPAGKDGTNPHLNSKYTTLDSLIEAIRGPLSANGLGFSQPITERDDGLYLGMRIFHESGQYEASYIRVVSMDASRATNAMQALGSTLAYLKRYMLAAALGLSSGDDDDGTNAIGPPKRDKQKSSPLYRANWEQMIADALDYAKEKTADPVED